MSIRLLTEFGYLYSIVDRAYFSIEEPCRSKARHLIWGCGYEDELSIYIDLAQQKRIELLVGIDCFKNLYCDLEGFLRILRLCKNNVNMAIILFEELKCEPKKKSNEQENQLTKS